MKKIYKFTIAASFICISALSNSTDMEDLEKMLRPEEFNTTVRAATRPNSQCYPHYVNLYELLVSRKDNRAKELSPVLGLCGFEPMVELYAKYGNAPSKSLSQRTTDLVSQIREYNGEQMAISAQSFMDEVVLPMREAIIKNNGDHIRDLVVIDNALKYSREKNFPEPFIIFLTKMKTGYYRYAK